MEFVSIYPFTRDNVGAGRFGNKRPGVILKKGSELGIHGVGPILVKEGGAIVAGYGGGRRGDGEIEDPFRSEDAVL